MRHILLDFAAMIPLAGELSAAILLLALAAASWAAADGKEGPPLSVEPSFLFVEHDGRVMPVLMAEFEAPRGGGVTVEVGRQRLTYRASELRRAFRRWLIPVPEVRRAVPATVTLSRAGEPPVQAEVTLRPQRRWRVFITPHTHFDIGFTHHQDVVWGNQAQNLSRVVNLCDETADWPVESRYRWTIEGWTLFDNFVNRASPDEVGRLVALIRQGRIEVMACPFNLQTSICSAEELIRSLYGAQRLRETHGIRIESAMINDVPGYTWALPMLFQQAGVRYLSARANPIRAMFLWHLPGAVERPFWWQSPDGSKVLTWYTDSYREGNFFRGGFREGMLDDPDSDGGSYRNLLGWLAGIEQHGYRHDAVQMRMGGDNLEAVMEPCLFAREWNRHFAFPRLIMATNSDFFHHLEASGDEFPTYRGDIPDWWADGVASAAAEMARNRQSQDLLAQAEALMAMARPEGWPPPRAAIAPPDVRAYPESLLPPAKAPAPLQADAGYDFALLFDEHTWGGGRGLRDHDRAVYDAAWETKAGYGATAADCARRAFEAALGEYQRTVTAEGRRVLVINTLGWPRTDVVRVTGLDAALVSIIDPLSGRAIPHQALPEGGLCFIAERVPAFAARAYRIENRAADDRGAAADGSEDRYRVEVDPATYRVGGILDLRTGRNLVNAAASWPFDAYVYESEHFGDKIKPYQGRPDTKGTYQADEPQDVTVSDHGTVFRRVTIRSRGSHAPSITQEITVYRGMDRVEVVNEFDKEATLDKEGVYFAFPFAVPDGEFTLELPNAAMRPERDQLPYSARDWYAIQHWVEVANRDFGITWVSLDAPLVALGEIRTNAWSEHINITDATIYSYVMNNYWYTNYPLEQGGRVRFRYAFRAHEGPTDRAAASRFGWELACPLIGVIAADEAPPGGDAAMQAGQSLLRCESRTGIVQGLKPARDGRGMIVRLLETAGRSDTVTISLPRPFAAWRTDLLENDRRRLEVGDGGVRIRLRPNELVTVRLVPGR